MPHTRLALAIPLLIALPTLSQQPASPDPIPTLHVTTRIVALDVVVTDGHGHPSTGLKPSDFSLTEDGVPQTIDSFVEHDASEPPQSTSTQGSQLPPNTFAVQPPALGNGAATVIVLANVDTANAPFVRSQFKAFLAASSITTPIAIFRQDGEGMHLVQGLTADRSVLLEAASSQRILPPLGFAVRFARRLGPPILTHYLDQIPGRINLVWFGEAQAPHQDEGLFPDMATSTPQDLAAFIRTAGNSASVHRLSRIAFYPILASGLVAPPICMAAHCPPVDVANVSYAAALRALPCLDTRVLALSAGGQAFCDTNGFKEALTQIVTTGAHYYTISYRPSNPDWDGNFRKIKIRLTNLPIESAVDKIDEWIDSGPEFLHPRLNYRDGYYARDAPLAIDATPSDSPTTSAGVPSSTPPHRTLISISPRGQSPLANTRMERALGFGTLTPTELHFTVVITPAALAEKLKPGEPLPPNNFLTAPFREFAYRNCKVHYWIEPQDLHFALTSSGTYADELQFVAMIYRDDGLVANSVAYTAHIQIAADQIEDIQANGLTFDQTIAITVPANPGPGSFFLRAGVDEISTGHIGALEVPVEWIKPTPPVTP